jgi:moderate conductance mechanosensitive channel
MEDKILKSAVVTVVSFVLVKFVPKLIQLPKSRQTSKGQTVTQFLQQAVTVIIYLLAVLVILNMFGVDVTPYLLSSSIIGFAVGFGAQSFFKDIIAGINLLLEPEFKINSVIVTNNYTGTIKKITLKNTYLEDKDGNLYIIPNGEIKTIQVKKSA